MILKDFSQYLQENKDTSAIILLNRWIKEKIENPAKSNIDRIIQNEIFFAKNKNDDTLLIGKGESGRRLIKALYNFALSFEQQKIARWIHNKKANDFNNC